MDPLEKDKKKGQNIHFKTGLSQILSKMKWRKWANEEEGSYL